MIPQDVELTIKFSGSYYLFLWILKRYKHELPYNGEVKSFALQNNYSLKICDQWRNYGVGYRVWNMLHKDITIIQLMNRIPVITLKQLEREYEAWKADDSLTK